MTSFKQAFELDIWNPAGYSKHSSVQKAAAADIISLLDLEGTEHVIDVGCGDGLISAAIAHLIPYGKVCGIDVSENMIKFATANFSSDFYPNLSFRVLNGQELPFQNNLDLIFSCFALQWFPEPEKFFKRAYMALNSGGRLGLTIPLCISPELSKSLEKICNLPEWADYFFSFMPGWKFQPREFYEEMLNRFGFVTELTNQVVCNKEFESIQELKLYVSQWLTHLKALPDSKGEIFLDVVIADYLKSIYTEKSSSIVLKFPRLDLIAKKP